MGLTISAKNRLEQGQLVSQELISINSDVRRWIAIYPLKDDRLKDKYPGFKYRVIDFELDKKLVDEFFAEEDKKNLKDYLVTSDVELITLLSEISVPAERFDAPWKNDYPL